MKIRAKTPQPEQFLSALGVAHNVGAQVIARMEKMERLAQDLGVRPSSSSNASFPGSRAPFQHPEMFRVAREGNHDSETPQTYQPLQVFAYSFMRN